MRTHGSILSFDGAPLTPPHKGEGDFAAAPRCINAGNFGQDDSVGVSLPLVGMGQGWGYAAKDDRPGEKRALNGAGP